MTAKIETVMDVLGEGGEMCISRVTKNGKVAFLYNLDETDLTDEGLDVHKNVSYSTFDEAFQCINNYPWHMLYVNIVHKDFANYVSEKLIEKLNGRKDNYFHFPSKIEDLEQLLFIVLFETNGTWSYKKKDNKAITKWQKSSNSLENYNLSLLTDKK